MHKLPSRLLARALLVATATFILACSGDDDSGGSSGSTDGSSMGALHVAMKDIAYDTTALTVMHGQTVQIDLENDGSVTHDFTIEHMPMRNLHMMGGASMDHMADQPHYDMHLAIDPGKAGQLEFKPTEPGTYEYYCTVAGHREAGMHGMLTVE